MKNDNRVAEVSINYLPKKFTSKLKINTSQDAHKAFRSHWSDDLYYREQMYILLLNRANMVLGISHLGSGTTAGVLVEIKMIMQLVIKANASSIAVAHNHPSENKKASRQDIELTNKLKEACKLMDIQLLDHLILCGEDYYSFADQGLL